MDPLDQILNPTPGQNGPCEASRAPAEDLPPGSSAQPGALEGQSLVARTLARRDVFWNNVVREILMALASAAAVSSGRLDTGPVAANASTTPVDDLFDGRMGVITTLGQRIPIADIIPVFACSMPNTAPDRSRANDVQCTVFRITTPTGESYTLPISQIIGVHSLTEALIEQLEDAANEEESREEERIPFGFGAYTSLARSEEDDEQTEQFEPGKASPDTEKEVGKE